MQHTAHTFYYRLDAYWRSVAIYAIVLLLYGLGRSLLAGTVQSDGKIEVVVGDPIFWLLSLFLLMSCIALGINVLLRRRVSITPEAISLVTRFRERHINRSTIRRIVIGREHAGWRRLRSVRIFIRGRRFPLRLRPSSYERDRELLHLLMGYLPANPAKGKHAP
ncbi:MAG: hypothetical protein N2663_07660 [Chlorobi bacterium]|nr:hypothetical protein [Chlorobiota bacterium]